MKRAISALLIALFLQSICISASAQATNKFDTEFDVHIRRTLEKLPDIPGIAVVVIKDDRPIFLKAYGMADKKAGLKADTDTAFYIASSTKSFTALAAAMLDKEGKIKFGDPITKYAKGVQFKNAIPDKVTVRDLLTHTSALSNGPLVHRTAFSGQIDEKEIDFVFANAMTFDDAAYGKYRYDNLGYNIYGILLDKTTKTKWQDLLQKRIFTPLGLNHTSAYRTKALREKWSIAAPYTFDDQSGTTVRSVLNKVDSNMQAAGGMFMSISDLGRWINMNMNGGRLDGKQVVPADLITAAHTGYTKTVRDAPPFSGDGEYGLGWQIGKYRTDKVVYHHGGFAGYRSHVSFMPDRRIGVGVLVNNDIAGSPAADMIATYAYDALAGMSDLEATYTKQLDDFVTRYETRKQQMTAAAAERAKRPSQLTKPLGTYVGTYTNDMFGTFEIKEDAKYLTVRLGNMFTRATAFTQPETIRVQMEPGGNGEVIKFDFAGDRVESLTYRGMVFKKSMQ